MQAASKVSTPSKQKPTVVSRQWVFCFVAQEGEMRTARPARRRGKTVRRTVFQCAARESTLLHQRTCRKMEKFCGRFSLAGKEEIRSKTHNMWLYSAKMCTTNLTQTVCLRLCGELFCFSGLTRSFSWTHGSGACPAPASSTAFSGQRPGPAGTAPCGCWPCPRLKNGGIQSHSSADQRRLPPE